MTDAQIRAIVAACDPYIHIDAREVERRIDNDGDAIIPIPDNGSEDAETIRAAIASRLGDGWLVAWTGNSRTHADGQTTSDLDIRAPEEA